MPCRLNPHRSQTLPAVSFFEGFQTPAGPEKTRAHSCGRHLKPITGAGMVMLSKSGRQNPWNQTFPGAQISPRQASADRSLVTCEARL